jgi:tRNA threonylcarbamoyladenosine biosynthesis protein TsaE
MAFGIHTTFSDVETRRLGETLGRTLPSNAVIALFGDLGAGKTTFIRGLVEGVGCSDLRTVSSPTFNLLNIYPGDKVVYHFDLYRLPRGEEFYAAGFDEHFTAGGVCCIEWADKIATALPSHTISVTLSYLGAEGRTIEIAGDPR